MSSTVRRVHRSEVAVAPAGVGVLGPERLFALIGRVGGGDRLAFAAIHDAMSVEVRTRVGPRLTGPAAASVTTAVFIEVWMLARFHMTPDTDVNGWVLGIADRRAGERRGDGRAGWPVPGTHDLPGVDPQTQWWAAMLAVDDRRAELVLTALLGRSAVPLTHR
jgi:hypothetical protein